MRIHRAYVKCDSPGCKRECASSHVTALLASSDVAALCRADGWLLGDSMDMCDQHRSDRQSAGASV